MLGSSVAHKDGFGGRFCSDAADVQAVDLVECDPDQGADVFSARIGSTPIKRFPPSEIRRAATVFTMTCSISFLDFPWRMSQRAVDLNSRV